MAKKKTPQKIQPRPEKTADAESDRADTDDVTKAEEVLGVHIIGKQDLQRHFGPSEADEDRDDSKR